MECFLTGSELSLIRTEAFQFLERLLCSLEHTQSAPISMMETYLLNGGFILMYMSKVLMFALALCYEVMELRRKELSGHDGLLTESRFMTSYHLDIPRSLSHVEPAS